MFLKLTKDEITASNVKYFNQIDMDMLTSICLQAMNLGYIKVINYLLTNTELKQNVDVHFNEDNLFCMAHFKKKLDVLNYLIFDIKIERTQHIDFLLDNIDDDITAAVKTMFSLRELNKHLNNTLSDSGEPTKNKNKV